MSSCIKCMMTDDERHCTIWDGLIGICAEMRLLDGSLAVVRTNPTPGFIALVEDSNLQRHHIKVVIGNSKSVIKNLVAEKAIQQLETEIRRFKTGAGPISSYSCCGHVKLEFTSAC